MQKSGNGITRHLPGETDDKGNDYTDPANAHLSAAAAIHIDLQSNLYNICQRHRVGSARSNRVDCPTMRHTIVTQHQHSSHYLFCRYAIYIYGFTLRRVNHTYMPTASPVEEEQIIVWLMGRR